MKLTFRQLVSPICNLTVAIAPILLMTPTALSEASIGEDSLTTSRGLAWAGSGLPFDDLVTIEDSLVKAPLGKVVIDRHGEDPFGGLFKTPFLDPEPGRFVVVSLWGSKIEGCFVQVVVQYAPPEGQTQIEGLLAKNLEIGVNDQILKLKVGSNTKTKIFKADYTYTKSKRQYSSTWFMTDNLFPVSASAASLLASAPKKTVKARLTFVDDSSKIIEIGGDNVARWKSAYGFNSACTAPK